ncbi:PorT family protein [Marinilabilia salmonicolor]|uniref:Outer membrane protein with beta-barrel domain n=1 Tax=Marinilabilia salmonicolor TaxID=989 RepID=A0A368VDN4_9BACT|nr:PorT family protein [Marinilabilia salmonicolor]RCW39268.1 hypothetical protein DFO77_10136 [Marinilabilia salmonicolor]
MPRYIIILLCSLLSLTVTFAQSPATQSPTKWTVEVVTSCRINNNAKQKGFGALLSRNLSGNWWLQSGLIYKNHKDYVEINLTSVSYSFSYEAELRLNYISIPLMLFYNSNFVNVGLGTYYERFLNSKDLSDNPLSETTASPGEKSKWYLTGSLGYPISIGNRLQLEPGILFNLANEKIYKDLKISLKYKF